MMNGHTINSSCHPPDDLILHHPNLGRLQGAQLSNEVIQFLGLQYATLRDGLSRGVLQEGPYCGAVWDATKHGPNVINPSDACEREQRVIQAHLPFFELPQSDVDCLNLNISVPATCITSPGTHPELSVLAFVHGGAFANGSSSHPQYDLARIVALSQDIGTPIMAIGINYRVGLPGFLHSAELEAMGYKPNNGIDDQRLAFRWIRRHVRGFGGDPTKVTFVGQSAGSTSGCFHLQRDEPLFHQFIGMGGSSLHRQRPYSRLQHAFDLVISELGADGESATQKVEALLSAVRLGKVGSLGRKYGVGPVVDGDIVPHPTSFSDLATAAEAMRCFPGIHWCKRIMVGDCAADGIAWLNRLAGRTDVLSKTLTQSLSIHLGGRYPGLVSQIVEEYDLSSDQSAAPILRFGSDLAFANPAQRIANAWSISQVQSSAAYLFHFDAPNPWNGTWKGLATHVLDIAFALLNFEDHLSAGQCACGKRLACDMIQFVNGGSAPWAKYSQSGDATSMRYFALMKGEDDLSAETTEFVMSEMGRVGFLYSLKDGKVLDRVMDAWQVFMHPK